VSLTVMIQRDQYQVQGMSYFTGEAGDTEDKDLISVKRSRRASWGRG
jgi:hypothetical protein